MGFKQVLKQIIKKINTQSVVFWCICGLLMATILPRSYASDSPQGLIFRVFKQAEGADPNYVMPGSGLESDGVMSNWNRGIIEAWVWSPSENQYRLYKTFPIAAYRGLIGPKTQQGDHQTPEGFYSISRLNSQSKYGGKGLWLNYPNEHDVNQSPRWTGGDIEIHGDHRSDGCLAMEDQIDEIYDLASQALQNGQKEIPVQIFPFPMTNQNLAKVRGEKWFDFWKDLKKGYDAFESTHQLPQVSVDPATRDYVVQTNDGSMVESSQLDQLPTNQVPGRRAIVSVPSTGKTKEAGTEIPVIDRDHSRSIEVESETVADRPVDMEIERSSLSSQPNQLIQVKQQVDHGCRDALREYFSGEGNREKIRKYLKIQGQLTLHRLAWSFLKNQQKGTEGIEKSIQELLKTRDPQLHGQFVNGTQRGKQRVSHHSALLGIFDDLQSKIDGRYGHDARNQPYRLKYSDRKMLNLLVNAEQVYGNSRAKGVIDFVNMIQSSYGRTTAGKEQNMRVAEKMIRNLELEKEKITKDLERFMASHGCPDPLKTLSCVSTESQKELSRFSDLLEESTDLQEELYATLNDRKEDILEANRWGSYWLHVGRSKVSMPSSSHE